MITQGWDAYKAQKNLEFGEVPAFPGATVEPSPEQELFTLPQAPFSVLLPQRVNVGW